MFQLTSPPAYALMLGIAALFGAIGGFVFELIQNRGGNTGTIEKPRSRARGAFFDLGWGASVIIGAVTAVAFLYFFPPTLEIRPSADKPAVLHYDLVELVALSLIVGSAGSVFLEATQARVLARLNQQKAEDTRAVAERQMEQLSEMAKVETENTVKSALTALQPQLEELLRESEEKTPPALEARLDGSDAVPKEVREYVASHPSSTEPEKKSEAIRETFDRVADKVRDDFEARMEANLRAAKSTVSSLAQTPPAGEQSQVGE